MTTDMADKVGPIAEICERLDRQLNKPTLLALLREGMQPSEIRPMNISLALMTVQVTYLAGSLNAMIAGLERSEQEGTLDQMGAEALAAMDKLPHEMAEAFERMLTDELTNRRGTRSKEEVDAILVDLPEIKEFMEKLNR